jgi:hypothetical protein
VTAMKRKLVLGLFLAIFLVLSSFEFAYAAQASGESIFVQIKADVRCGYDKIVRMVNVKGLWYIKLNHLQTRIKQLL